MAEQTEGTKRRGRPPKDIEEKRTASFPVQTYLTEEQRRMLDWLRGGSSRSTYLARLIEEAAQREGWTGQEG